MGYYERLSALDESFLAFETPNAHMHVALVTIFDGGSLVRRNRLDTARIRRYVASRLHLVPRYRQKLRIMPLTGDVAWVDDDCFELDHHVRFATLPEPGGERQLQRRAAEILERLLDRGRPLWESWFVDGLAGERLAMITKVHHCMVDGVAGVDILSALLSPEPASRVQRAPRWNPRGAPSDVELLGGEMRRRMGAARRLFGAMGSILTEPTVRSDLPRRVGALWNLVRAGVSSPPQLPFNAPIGPNRRVAWHGVDLSEVKAIKASLGGTLNDVVLATAAGALRRFLEQRGAQVPSGQGVRVVVPVSVRTRDDRGAAGNRVSTWMVDLPVTIRNVRERYAAVVRTTEQMKKEDRAQGANLLTEAAEWTTGNILDLAIRSMNQAHLYNMVVTNVPGPPIPLYLLSARLTDAYPFVPLFANQGLGLALFSYDGRLFWGFAADWDLVPDIEEFRRCVEAELDELGRLAARCRRRDRSSRRAVVSPLPRSAGRKLRAARR